MAGAGTDRAGNGWGRKGQGRKWLRQKVTGQERVRGRKGQGRKGLEQ